MRKVVSYFFVLIITIVSQSCSSEVDEISDIADSYVGNWNWKDKEISKTDDFVTVDVRKLSSEEIEISNFHGILSAKFKVEGHDLFLIDTDDSFLTEVVSGKSTYDYKTVNFVYYYDNQKYRSQMTKN
jgi:hypothetical protein